MFLRTSITILKPDKT